MSQAHFTTDMNPNSQHQIWSQWEFVIQADIKRPAYDECKENFRKWVEMGFKTKMGRGKILMWPNGKYHFVVQIEGPPAHDPEYRESVKANFAEHFVTRGFGSGAVLEQFEVGILAGDSEDGKPPSQLIVIPKLDLKSLLAKG